MAKSFNISDPFISTFRTRGKAITGGSLPEFKLTGSWRPNKHGDAGLGTWANTGVGFTIASKDKQFEQKQFHNLTQRAKNDKGIQTTTGWINKDTLNKGVNTILGMSEQRDEEGYLIQGENYANPYAFQGVDPDWQSNAGHYSGVQSSKKQQFENQKQKVQNIMDARKSGSKLPTALQGGKVEELFVESQRNAAHGIDSSPSSMSSQVNKRNLVRRANRYANFEYYAANDPTIGLANTIQSKLGRSKITAYKKRNSWIRKDGSRGYSKRYEGALTGDPESVIDDYYKKTGIINWAKEVNPGHANLDDVISHGNKGNQMDLLYDKIKKSNKQKKEKYETYYEPIINDDTYKELARLTAIKAKGQPSGIKVVKHLYYLGGGETGPYMQRIKAANRAIAITHQSNLQKHAQLERDIHDREFDTYAYTDKDFEDMETLKQSYISEIGMRRENQEYIIGDLGLDTKTIEKKDRSKHLIPTLDTTYTTLDTKADKLKKQVTDYDWKKKISQDAFGSDTIQGHSMIGAVLDSYGGKLRGGDYYAQDIGQLVKKSKSYEAEMESQIKQKKDIIDKTKLDDTSSLPEYYMDTMAKESHIVEEEYLSKSLAKTTEDRKELEKQKKQLDYNKLQGGQNISLSIGRGGRSARPNLKSFSRRNSGGGGQKKIRGGQNTLGGLVI